MDQALPLALWAPPAVVMAAVVGSLLADATGHRRASLWLAGVGLALAAAGCFLAAAGPDARVPVGALASGGGFTSLPGVGYALAACAVFAGLDRLGSLERGTATAALIALGAIFSHALIASIDMKVLFIALAGSATVAYAIVGGTGSRRAEEAAVRYFIQGTVASGLTVYGLALIFGLAGGVSDYLDAAAALSAVPGRASFVALGLLASFLGFKLGAFPFHAWVPDAYETGNASEVAFLASTPKLAAFVALLVAVQGTLFASGGFAAPKGLFVALAVGSLLFGAFGMLRQRSVGRLLGYSAIAQVGYGLAAVASGDGVSATVIFALTYAVGVAAAFVSLEAVARVRPEWDGSLHGLAGLSRRSPLIAACLAVSMLSLTGIPLFAGFWGKFFVLAALIEANMTWLAVVAGLVAVVSFAAYGSVIRWAYFETAAEGETTTLGTAGELESLSASSERTAQHASESPSDSEPSQSDVPAGADRGRGVRAGAAGLVASVLAVTVLLLGCVPLVSGIEPLASFFGLR